ncbi:MAG: aminopeptidase P family protein [Candidatus Eremiobacteraeota bacterium]|nr:aminopeptidase P family protein [Candidatus Eremiobacteraeota bacterium]
MSAQPKDSAPANPAQASHDFEPPQALVDFMATGWEERPVPQEVQAYADRFAQRRAELSQAYPGTYLLIPAGKERVRANDTSFRFRPSSDFAYLVGVGEPGSVLVLEPAGAGHRALLFVRAHNRGTRDFFADRVNGELWVGRHRGVTESETYYRVDECRPLAALREYLDELRTGKYPLRLARSHDVEIDQHFSESEGDAELAERLAEMRLIKDDHELAELRNACAISKRAFADAIRAMRTAASERAIEGAFWNRARIEANDVGYLTIAGAGPHACTLHWDRNDGPLHAGDLLLLDAGVECDSLYTADITRTLPIDGRYSPEQRQIYDLVWEAQRAGIEGVAAGNDFLEPHRRAMRVLAEGLVELGILKMSVEEALDPDHLYHRRYTLHGTSHMLGLDVHDCADARSSEYRYGKLRDGMVLTVEPGLYFQPDDTTVPERFRGIGVRIEDDIAVTGGAPENLSASLPARADDVEGWIAEIWDAPRSDGRHDRRSG